MRRMSERSEFGASRLTRAPQGIRPFGADGGLGDSVFAYFFRRKSKAHQLGEAVRRNAFDFEFKVLKSTTSSACAVKRLNDFDFIKHSKIPLFKKSSHTTRNSPRRDQTRMRSRQQQCIGRARKLCFTHSHGAVMRLFQSADQLSGAQAGGAGDDAGGATRWGMCETILQPAGRATDEGSGQGSGHRQAAQATCNGRTMYRAAEQYDATPRQLIAELIQHAQNDQSAEAVTDQVQARYIQSGCELVQRPGIFGQCLAYGGITEAHAVEAMPFEPCGQWFQADFAVPESVHQKGGRVLRFGQDCSSE